MFELDPLGGIAAVAPEEWAAFTEGADLDAEAGFMRFREYLEPGDSVLLTLRENGRLRGALHAIHAVPGSGLSSDPWKFLTSDAVLRSPAGADGPEPGVRRHRAEIVAGMGGAGAPVDEQPLWSVLTERLGPCLVIREFDSSRLMYHRDATPAEQLILATELVGAAQDLVRERGAGALCFPYVETDNDVLREALAKAGFRRGVMTAASRLSTAGFTSYDEFLAALPSRRRRMYKVEENALRQAGDLVMGEADLKTEAARVAQLEAQTLVKHGGTATAAPLEQARRVMIDCLPESAFVPAVRRADELVACAVHLVGARNVYFMAYGCDYSVEERSSSYPWAAFYSAVRRAVADGLDGVLLGLEGLEAKSRRGALVEPRESWFWLADEDALAGVGALLDLVTTRNNEYLEQFLR